MDHVTGHDPDRPVERVRRFKIKNAGRTSGRIKGVAFETARIGSGGFRKIPRGTCRVTLARTGPR